MLYTENFSMRHYVGFSQIGSHIYIYIYIYIHKLIVYLLSGFNHLGIDANNLTQFLVSISTTNLYMANINITDNTLRGNWTVTLVTQGYYSIQVSAISDLTISSDLFNLDSSNTYGFSLIEGRPTEG